MLEFGNTKFINLKFINLSFELIENENHFDRMQNRGRKKYQITPVLVKITRGYMVGQPLVERLVKTVSVLMILSNGIKSCQRISFRLMSHAGNINESIEKK